MEQTGTPHSPPPCLFFLSCYLLLSCRSLAIASKRGEDAGTDRVPMGSIGAVLDLRCRTGKEERIAMEVALDDFYDRSGYTVAVFNRDSGLDPKQAAMEASRLIDEKKVQAILGLRTWPQTAEVAELGDRASVPVLSFADGVPSWATDRWPFLLQFTPSYSPQITAISAIIGSWHWRKVAVIYEEDDGYAGADSIPHFMDAIQAVGSDVDYQLALSPFAPMAKELEKLKTRRCSVFVVHTSLTLATSLFAGAAEMGMMGKGYAWVTTGAIADHLDSANSSVIGSMQGVIGTRSFIPRASDAYTDLSRKFQRRFAAEYPGELIPELSINGLQAYDAVWAVADAMRRLDAGGDHSSRSPRQRQLLEHISASNFSGASGKVQFVLGKLVPPEILEIVNIVGSNVKEMGFWMDEFGFSRSIAHRTEPNLSMAALGQASWPGGTGSAPRGWVPSTGKNPLRIGVSSKSVFPDFVRVEHDDTQKSYHFTGFAIDIFDKAVKYLPYDLPYQFHPYDGTNDDMVAQVFSKAFDVVVGDTAILSSRCEMVQFSQPYTPSGITMVVPLEPVYPSMEWIFLRPFTASLWATIAAIGLINAFAVWLIERRSSPEYQGLSQSQQLGNLMWLSFTALFPQGERPHHNLSRVVMVVWIFVGLVLTSNYTAILSSMLTVQMLEPAVADVDQLRRTNAAVGCNSGGSVARFLNEVLAFPADRIKEISTEEGYYEAFRRGEIKAAFLGYGHGRVFLAKYCKDFTAAGPTYPSGGFGFVFPKRSLLLPDMTTAILKLFETGVMQEMEDGLLSSYNCSSLPTSNNDSLGVGSFWGLLAIMGVTSMLVLIVFFFTHRESSRVAVGVIEKEVQQEGGDKENPRGEARGR
uniref:Glutamate receptor n=1 Tax=Anthurium amnicola TaxID=1678845 RepID=A0A1D1YS45_9ARAE